MQFSCFHRVCRGLCRIAMSGGLRARDADLSDCRAVPLISVAVVLLW